MVFSRQELLHEAAELVARARLAEDSQKAAALIKQAADMLETVAEILALDDPDVRVHYEINDGSGLRETR